jgi:Putative Ig domain
MWRSPILIGLIWTLVIPELNCGGGATTTPPLGPKLSITTADLVDGMVTFPYSQTMQPAGGVAPFVWSVSSGSLPHNITLDSSTANISGTPDTAELATFTIQVKDANGQTAVQSYTLNINSTGLPQLQSIAGQVPAGTVEIQGVSAGPFNPPSWQQDTLNWVPDVRMPIFAARTTSPYQNIYAPWPLEQSNGWRMFYGGWDGLNPPYDEIDSTVTNDFLSFGPRDVVIAHGEFQNVNNVNVQQLPDGSLHMICTGGQLGNVDTFPVYFSSPDGTTWNGTPEPYSTRQTDIINIQGYAGFSSGNFNGANVLLRDGDAWVLYFKDWNQFDTTYRATAVTLPNFQLQGVALKSDDLVNDVKKFRVTETTWYVMGLHFNGELVRYSLSSDGVSFAPEQVLFRHLSAQDRYMVAVGFVTQGDKLLGVLYGASAVESLDQNQIFARWLQKKIVVKDSSGNQITPQGSYGPDRQQFAISSGLLQGTIWVYAEDGLTPLATGQVSLTAGQSYQLTIH